MHTQNALIIRSIMSDLLWVGIGTVFNSEVPFCVCALFRVKHGTHRMHLYFLLTETQVFVLMATYTHEYTTVL